MIRLKAVDPRTGREKEVAKLLEGVSAQQAAQKRAELMDGIKKLVERTETFALGNSRNCGSTTPRR
ncbi:MAG: hypothetical protein H0V17_00170 [Deltaproteobacteria bacterium]|nr:hypothetical protein [Deltaproteobacteria bacterium]